ncbi:MAG: flagellar basal body P-ring protein FlgI [Planctomycetota bacterium]
MPTSPCCRPLVLTSCLTLAALGASLFLTACGSSSKRRPRSVTPSVAPGPAALSGTIGQMATISGTQPTLVSGYGLVVGLNGAGGGPLPEAVAGHMERVMGLQGVSRANDNPNSLIAGLSPQELLRDPNTAVVLVQAVIPPGAPQDMTFDVYARALNATSLEGGRLWTTELRIGQAQTFGGYQTVQLAEARGNIFVNPFIEPGRSARGTTSVVGRVLDGGAVTDPLELLVTLDTPSHARVRTIASAINGRFPEGPGDRGPIARGRDGENIGLTIPARYQERPNDFLKIVEHLHINQSFPEELARRYVSALREQPQLAEELSWSIQAVGEPAVPFLRDVYDVPEAAPRLAALDAGVKLGDARATPYLLQTAQDENSPVRSTAVRMLGQSRGGPEIDLALKNLLAESELTIRIAAYEALAERAERAEFGRLARSQGYAGRNSGAPIDALRARSRAFLPAGTIQGIQRRVVENKFVLDRAPYGDPLIYVTQQGLPRIVLFGSDLKLERPSFVSAWSDRLMLASDSPSDEVIRVFYRDHRTGSTTTETVPPRIEPLVRLMAHEPRPERPTAGPGLGQGLNLSYAEVVGALYAVYEDGGTNAAFATERDRLLADLLSAGRATFVEERPESANDEEIILFEAPETPRDRREDGDPAPRPLVVPIDRGPLQANAGG